MRSRRWRSRRAGPRRSRASWGFRRPRIFPPGSGGSRECRRGSFAGAARAEGCAHPKRGGATTSRPRTTGPASGTGMRVPEGRGSLLVMKGDQADAVVVGDDRIPHRPRGRPGAKVDDVGAGGRGGDPGNLRLRAAFGESGHGQHCGMTGPAGFVQRRGIPRAGAVGEVRLDPPDGAVRVRPYCVVPARAGQSLDGQPPSGDPSVVVPSFLAQPEKSQAFLAKRRSAARSILPLI